MKTAWILTVLLVSTRVALSQGTITFDNDIPGQVVAPIYGPEPGNNTLFKTGNTPSGYPPGTQFYSGSLLSGPSWSAQLLAAPGVQPEGSLIPISPVTTFNSGIGAGFILPVTFTPSFPGGTTTATFEMVVWDNLGGTLPTWSAAEALWQGGQIAAGRSELYLGPASGDTTFLRSFNVAFVPEPAPAAFVILGLLLIRFKVRASRTTVD